MQSAGRGLGLVPRFAGENRDSRTVLGFTSVSEDVKIPWRNRDAATFRTWAE